MPLFLKRFLYGATFLLAGLGWFRKKPKLMILGIIPAITVGVVLVTVIFVLGSLSSGVIVNLTGFTDSWADWAQTFFRVALQVGFIAMLAATGWMVFVGLSLMVGEPFYNKIWQKVEEVETGTVPSYEPGFKEAVADGFTLIGKGILVGLLGAVIGVIPLVGSVAALVVTVTLNGRVFAEEITSRALVARGKSDQERDVLWANYKWEMLGFGVATQLAFLIPFAGVFVMPSVIVGGTLLSQKMVSTP